MLPKFVLRLVWYPFAMFASFLLCGHFINNYISFVEDMKVCSDGIARMIDIMNSSYGDTNQSSNIEAGNGINDIP